ncbi:hypothetical protein FA13DRAFT_1784891 [Coprinellus micaceus]|uniref:Uncharacterized protein n=1 Tax=Coprinellus micaceus TaxID=71717 RepID=A0A4Y7TY90_COPMI|nr:hypothetical protein FA13DRAFT_1784891 [Coprinellus micaceus]
MPKSPPVKQARRKLGAISVYNARHRRLKASQDKAITDSSHPVLSLSVIGGAGSEKSSTRGGLDGSDAGPSEAVLISAGTFASGSKHDTAYSHARPQTSTSSEDLPRTASLMAVHPPSSLLALDLIKTLRGDELQPASFSTSFGDVRENGIQSEDRDAHIWDIASDIVDIQLGQIRLGCNVAESLQLISHLVRLHNQQAERESRDNKEGLNVAFIGFLWKPPNAMVIVTRRITSPISGRPTVLTLHSWTQ